MLDHLSHITDDTFQGITIQICVAVADMALLMGTWQDPFGEFGGAWLCFAFMSAASLGSIDLALG